MLVANGPHARASLHKHCGYPPLQFPASVQYAAMGCEATGVQAALAFAAAFQDSGQSVAATLLSCFKQRAHRHEADTMEQVCQLALAGLRAASKANKQNTNTKNNTFIVRYARARWALFTASEL